MQRIARSRMLLKPHLREAAVKRISSALMMLVLTTIMPAGAADTTERLDSLPDAHPECMQVNGPDCVLRSPTMPSRTAPPQVTIAPPVAAGTPVAPALPGTALAPATTSPVTTSTEVTDVIMPPPVQRRATAVPGK